MPTVTEHACDADRGIDDRAAGTAAPDSGSRSVADPPARGLRSEPARRRRLLRVVALLGGLPWLPGWVARAAGRPGVPQAVSDPEAAAGGALRPAGTPRAQSSAAQRLHAPALAAAWNDEAGTSWAGLLAPRGTKLAVLARIELPTRAHGLLPGPRGEVLVVARRPGDWLLRWQPALGEAGAEWVWAEPERVFNGHAVWSADGRHLFTTETDLASGAGLIGVRDAHSLQRLAEWPTHGLDPHELLLDDGRLIVANGGIPTQPETGRSKRHLDRMDSSLVRLDTGNGRLLGQWRLDDPRLSLRHLARLPVPSAAGEGARIGIALQAEHDDAARRNEAPVLALFDGRRLHTAPAAQPLAGYGGAIATFDGGFWVGCPRVNGVARFDAQGRWQGLLELREACALAAGPGERLWMGGNALAAARGAGGQTRYPAPGLRLDNHWVWRG